MITVQLEENGPITEMDEALLVKTEGVVDDDNELTRWVEYRLSDRVVHRSVHVHLKKGVFGEGIAANLT